jgi:hypothetical protein
MVPNTGISSGGLFEGIAVALHLLAHVAHGILAAAFFILVDHHQIGEIEHVDLFQLGGGPEFAGHDVHGEVHQVDDAGIPLADAGGFGDDQVVAGRLGHMPRHRPMASGISVMRTPGRHGAHVDPRAVDGVHADAVAQQGAAGFAAGGIGADDGDADVLQIVEHAQDQLIGQGGFTRPAGAGDADHRHFFFCRFSL